MAWRKCYFSVDWISQFMQERTVDLLVTLNRGDDAPEGLTRQLYAQLRTAIVSGRLRAGERLPSTRDFAHQLQVARLTVATAYDWLRAEGYVYGRVGAGTFVAPVFEARSPLEEPPRSPGSAPAAPISMQERRAGH